VCDWWSAPHGRLPRLYVADLDKPREVINGVLRGDLLGRCEATVEVKLRRRGVLDSVSPGGLSRLHLSGELLQQRRRIVLLPDDVELEPDIHVRNSHQSDVAGTVPTHGFRLPREPDPALDKTQIGVAIRCLLDYARSAQAPAGTLLHQSIVEDWIYPAREPHERHATQISQQARLTH